MDDLIDVVRRLRAPDGCPWDREQTHRSLRPYLLEETHEVLEAIDSGDPVKLQQELGDLLLQVVMHSAMAEEAGQFTIADVSAGEAAKMVSRHPHVFGDAAVADADEVLVNWERLKAQERLGRGSALDGTPTSLPALARALAVQKRAARIGVVTEAPDTRALLTRVSELAARAAGPATAAPPAVDPGPTAPPAPETSPGPVAGPDPLLESELGELLFALVDLSRRLRVNPEDALRMESDRFAARFRAAEQLARDAGEEITSLPKDRVNQLWERVGSEG